MSTDNNAAGGIEGFILTRQWLESSGVLELIFWLATERGPLRLRISGQEAVCFFPSSQQQQVEDALSTQRHWRIRPTKLKNFNYEPMSALYFKSQRRLFDCRDKLSARNIDVVESDIKPTDRFLMERFITAAAKVSGVIESRVDFSDVTVEKIVSTQFRPRLKAVSIDIETNNTATKLYSIAIYSDTESSVFMLGSSKGVSPGAAKVENLELNNYPTEREVIIAFVERIHILDPDVIIGWNVVNFDLRRLQDFSDRLKIPLNLGRNAEAISWRKDRNTDDRFYALLPGRIVLDGIELMRTATYQFENFSLEYVSRQLLNRGKLVEDVDQRGAEITELFNTDKAALARYNLEDCRLVWDIFEKEKLINFAVERSLLTGLELDRYGGSVAAFDFLYLPRLHRKGFVAPSFNKSGQTNVSPGGYVMTSVPGIHENVLVLDFKSLYPSIIRTFHVDPLAMVVAEQESNPIGGYDGGSFSRTEFILPEIITSLWTARDKAKADGNAVLSQAIKIIMNSFYGILGTPGCRFLDSRLVSSITKRGHQILIESKSYIEEKGYQVIYGDTDSVFVLLGPVAGKKANKIGGELVLQLNRWWRERLDTEFGIESFLEMEFETHFSKFLMPTVRGSDTGSKKRYAGVVVDDIEQGKSHMLFKGLESVRSDWSPLAREFQRVLYERIFFDKSYEDYIKQTVAEINAGKYENELVLRKRIRRKLSDYIKNVPPHVQAARKAEAVRAERGLPKLYQSGGWIEYIMTINGPEPRQYRQSAIDYDFYIDKQLAPIVDSILVFKSSSMDAILNNQIGLFL